MRNKMEKQTNIPFQIQHLIQEMLNPRDNVYVRGNYRVRLDEIRKELDVAIRKYDDEVAMANTGKRKRRA